MDTLHTRIAPTPSGLLHIGNAFNFLYTEALVLQQGGTLRLRIDDLDSPRLRAEYLDDIFESLAWLGIWPDEGPKSPQEHESLFSQRLRLPAYEEGLRQLVNTGLVFACTCSRKKIAETATNGQYPGTCLNKNIPLNQPGVAWRIQTPPEYTIHFDDALMGPVRLRLWEHQCHFIIRRRDGLPAYQVASLLDDVAYGINTIVRGEDLLSSTAAQCYLARLLGLDAFLQSRFYHHRLLLDAQGQKLSKSAGSNSLKAMRNCL
ncbi:MAG: tRNA glutamyl-Q synthetase [Bacteroidetes bacterium]|nr:tRNA glutamyl-Q synthetase [Bacteroidota bacterium]MBS1628514.1 tRNA glutamyl-Q synthetase [Bacteroidota bacterium]